MKATDRMIREKECAELTGLSRTTRYRYEMTHQFPRRRQLGSHTVGWLLSEVMAWMQTIGVSNEENR